MKLLFMTSPAPQKAGLSTAEKRPPLGTGFLISVLKKKGHQLYFSDEYLKPSGILDGDFLERERIDAVGIYSNTICYSGTLELLSKLQSKREKGAWRGKVLVGGPHTSAALETIPDFVDHVVIGEGEISVPEAIEGNISDRVVVGQRVLDMDSIPRPAWEEFIYRGYDWTSPWSDAYPVYTMNTSRGCPFQCSFCSVKAVWGRSYRCMSAERVVEDVEHMVRHYGAKGIYFREDHFTLNKRRTVEFCELLLKKGISIEWYCETRVDQLDDPEYQALMAKAGCRAFYIGVESGSPRMLKLFKKEETVEQFIRAFEIAHSVGIKTHASFVVGTPFESAEDAMLTEQLIERIRPHMLGKNIYIGLPGSEIYKRILEDEAYEYKDESGILYVKGYLDCVEKYYEGNAYYKPYELPKWENRDMPAEVVMKRVDWEELCLLRESNVVLFGSGSLANRIYQYLHERNIFPSAVFDNDAKRQGALFKDLRIVNPCYMKGAKVIIASMWKRDMASQLAALGYQGRDILHVEVEA